MQIAPDFLLVGLLSPKTFTLRNMPSTLSFCAEPKSEVAESIIQKINIAHREREDGLRPWVRANEENFLPPLSSRPEGELLHREKVFLCFLKLWILQLWASPACRMTWEWGDRREEESSSLSVQLQTAQNELLLFYFKHMIPLKKSYPSRTFRI